MKRLLILLIFAAPVVCSANSLPLLSNLPLLPAQIDLLINSLFQLKMPRVKASTLGRSTVATLIACLLMSIFMSVHVSTVLH